jgi:hypothetical protein
MNTYFDQDGEPGATEAGSGDCGFYLAISIGALCGKYYADLFTERLQPERGKSAVKARGEIPPKSAAGAVGWFGLGWLPALQNEGSSTIPASVVVLNMQSCKPAIVPG